MGLLERLFGTRIDGPTQKPKVLAQYAPPTMDIPFASYGSFGGYNTYSNAILRQEAMAVPTVNRCRNLICQTIASIPLETYSTTSGAGLANMNWVDQPDIRQPRAVTLAWTCDSLFMYGVAYWMVTELYQNDNRPARFEWVQNDRVTVKYDKDNAQVDYYMINGLRVPMDGIGSLVTFQALDQGLLLKAQVTIRSALDVEKAASIAAQTPMGTGYIKNNGADIPDEQVQGILAAWRTARSARATAYLTNTLDFTPISYSPSEMLYNDAKAYLALELCRACNVPAPMADAQQMRVQTYQNVLDQRKEFYAFSLAPYVTAIESRLSMDDLTPRGQEIRFAVDETFLRADPVTRLQVVEQLLTLNLIDVNQAKEMEGLTPDGNED